MDTPKTKHKETRPHPNLEALTRPSTAKRPTAIKKPRAIQRLRTENIRRTLKFTIIATALAVLSAVAPASTHAYVSPITQSEHPGTILRAFDKPQQNWLAGHRGLDLDAQPGQIIYSAGDGTVAFAGNVAGTPVISIDHSPPTSSGPTKRTTYQPVNAFLQTGDLVTEGQPIGFLAQPINDHLGLHWGLLVGRDDYANPLTLLDKPVIRLKPWDGRF